MTPRSHLEICEEEWLKETTRTSRSPGRAGHLGYISLSWPVLLGKRLRTQSAPRPGERLGAGLHADRSAWQAPGLAGLGGAHERRSFQGA